MSGVIYPLPQYAFLAWCLVKAQGQLYLYPQLDSDKAVFAYPDTINMPQPHEISLEAGSTFRPQLATLQLSALVSSVLYIHIYACQRHLCNPSCSIKTWLHAEDLKGTCRERCKATGGLHNVTYSVFDWLTNYRRIKLLGNSPHWILHVLSSYLFIL
jgi:hypothetical protein